MTQHLHLRKQEKSQILKLHCIFNTTSYSWVHIPEALHIQLIISQFEATFCVSFSQSYTVFTKINAASTMSMSGTLHRVLKLENVLYMLQTL